MNIFWFESPICSLQLIQCPFCTCRLYELQVHFSFLSWKLCLLQVSPFPSRNWLTFSVIKTIFISFWKFKFAAEYDENTINAHYKSTPKLYWKLQIQTKCNFTRYTIKNLWHRIAVVQPTLPPPSRVFLTKVVQNISLKVFTVQYLWLMLYEFQILPLQFYPKMLPLKVQFSLKSFIIPDNLFCACRVASCQART